MYDVVISGAGPAGSACAYRLANAGCTVAIVERSAFPRTKVCGEYLNAGARAELATLGPLDLHDANPVRAIRLMAHGAEAVLPFLEPAFSLARSHLDTRLLANACAAGATLIQGRVERVDRDMNHTAVTFRDDSGAERTLIAKIVIGADGTGSAVARTCGLTKKQHGEARFAVGGHYEGFGDLDGCIEMYVDAHAYFAINPLGEDLANVMIIVRERDLHGWRDDVDAHLRRTARELGGGTRNVDNVRLSGKRVAVGPLTHRVHAAALRGIYLTGDAAGFIDPFTGQGVFMALRTARLASSAILAELGGDVEAYSAYQKAHAQLFALRRRVGALVSLLTRTPVLARRAARNLKRSEVLRETVMRAISGNAGAASLLSPSALLQLVA